MHFLHCCNTTWLPSQGKDYFYCVSLFFLPFNQNTTVTFTENFSAIQAAMLLGCSVHWKLFQIDFVSNRFYLNYLVISISFSDSFILRCIEGIQIKVLFPVVLNISSKKQGQLNSMQPYIFSWSRRNKL